MKFYDSGSKGTQVIDRKPRTDGRTDRQTDRNLHSNIPPFLKEVGGHNYQLYTAVIGNVDELRKTVQLISASQLPNSNGHDAFLCV